MKYIFMFFSLFGAGSALYITIKVIRLDEVTPLEMVLYFLCFALSLTVLFISYTNLMKGGKDEA